MLPGQSRQPGTAAHHGGTRLTPARRLLDRLARDNPLPAGTFSVGAGVVVAGITSYLFLAIAARALGPDRFAPLSVMWIVTFVAGPGFFLPLEQEVGRALAHRFAASTGGGPVIRRAAQIGAILASGLVVVVLATSPLLVDNLFRGNWLLLVGFVLALVGYFAGHLGRGTLSGMGRFVSYGAYMGSEGVIRVILCIGLAVAGVHTVGLYGLAVGIPPMIAIWLAVRRERDLVVPGPEAPWSELSANLGYLLAGSVLSAALVNAGPIAVELLKETAAEEDLAGKFTTSVVIARVPLFLFQAVQASLLPRLASLAGSGNIADFRAGFRRLLLAVCGIGVVAVIGAVTVGPLVVRILFGSEYDLGRRNLTMLAAASAVYMAALALAQALIALHGHARVALGWGLGLATFGVATALGDDLLLRVEIGLVAGSVVACAVFAALVARLLDRGVEPDADSLLEAITDLPLES